MRSKTKLSHNVMSAVTQLTGTLAGPSVYFLKKKKIKLKVSESNV